MWKCINLDKVENCKFVFTGKAFGTDEKLCNILSEEKPCVDECVCLPDKCDCNRT